MAQITVTGTYEDISGNPQNGTVTFTPVSTGTDGTVVFLADPVSAKVQGGLLSKTIATTDTYETDGAVTYRIVTKVGSTGRTRFYASLPSSLGATVDLATVIHFPNPPNQIQLDSGTTPIDFTTHIATDHAPLIAELADHESRIDDLETAPGTLTGSHTDLLNRSAADSHPMTAITGLTAALGAKQDLDSDLTAIGSMSPANGSIIRRISGVWAESTLPALKTAMAFVKGDVGLGNVDNTSDATKNSASATLTNKGINGANNTITNIDPSDTINGWDAMVASIPEEAGIVRRVFWSSSTGWPLRSASGTIDPNEHVEWVGGTTAPPVSGTGSTGAIGSSVAGEIKDSWLAEA